MTEPLPKLRFVNGASKSFRFKSPKPLTPTATPAPVDEESVKILESVARCEEAEAQHKRTETESLAKRAETSRAQPKVVLSAECVAQN